MWVVVKAIDKQGNCLYEKKLGVFKKKHRQEIVYLMGLLKKYFQALQSGVSPLSLSARGWIHPEPNGIKALALHKRGLNASRLYIYCHAEWEELLLLTIGTKDTQGKDIKQARELLDYYFVKKKAEDLKDGK